MKRKKQLRRLDEDQAVCVCAGGATFRGAANGLPESEVSASKVSLLSPLLSFLPSSEI